MGIFNQGFNGELTRKREMRSSHSTSPYINASAKPRALIMHSRTQNASSTMRISAFGHWPLQQCCPSRLASSGKSYTPESVLTRKWPVLMFLKTLQYMTIHKNLNGEWVDRRNIRHCYCFSQTRDRGPAGSESHLNKSIQSPICYCGQWKWIRWFQGQRHDECWINIDQGDQL